MITRQEKCRVCGSSGTKQNYLFYCHAKGCRAVHWDKRQLRKRRSLIIGSSEYRNRFLNDAGVPIERNQGHHIYTLRLRGKLNSVYVGMTGLHPYERYLNHILGYKASSKAKKKATALIRFEGPMPSEAAKLREVTLAEELRLKGMDVHGGH